MSSACYDTPDSLKAVHPKMDIAFALVVPAFAMFAAHWVQWRRIIGGDLPRPIAYSYGVGVIIATCTFLFWYEHPSWQMATAYLWLVAGSAGAATLAAYAVDSAVERKHLEADRRHRMESYANER